MDGCGDTRQNKTHEDAIAALKWLETHYPDSSYGMLNHPRRYLSSYTIQDVRELNDVARMFSLWLKVLSVASSVVTVVTMVSVVVECTAASIRLLLRSVAGGMHYWVKVVEFGTWVTRISTSKTRTPYASSYYPGEYAKSYTWVDGKDTTALLKDYARAIAFLCLVT